MRSLLSSGVDGDVEHSENESHWFDENKCQLMNLLGEIADDDLARKILEIEWVCEELVRLDGEIPVINRLAYGSSCFKYADFLGKWEDHTFLRDFRDFLEIVVVITSFG